MKNPCETTDATETWPFDQGPRVATLTTRQVIESEYPILQVVHYEDDHSWAFLCGTTDEDDDFRLVHMEEILAIDSSIRSIASLAPGMLASRVSVGSDWEVEPLSDD